jgi:hypothetical protein
MDSNSISLVIRALERAALHGTVLPYTRFHALFSGEAPLTQRYAVLEAAVRSLSDSPDLDYGVLLACDNGLPGAEFFRRFQKRRRDAYVAALGDPRFKSATVKGKRQLVAQDRRRIYEHAARLRQQERERERECA